MLHTDRNNFGTSQADGETDDYNTTRLANNANFRELDKNTAKCNWEATSDPTVNDDSSLGYSEGSVWHNITSGKRFILKDATDGAADWWQTYPPVGPIPAGANNLVKLGAAGEIQDSGVNIADMALKVIPAADGNLAQLDLATGAIEDSGINPSTLARRAATPTNGHVAGIDADGDPTDSGETVADLADAIDKKHAAAGDDNFVNLAEKTTPTGSMKLLVNDGTYGPMSRQNFLLGVKGGINFIKNSDFEAGVNGQAPSGDWGTYKDAAQAIPVDGTGGSPSLTFLCSNSVILNGGMSARITKPASNCQGEGVNCLFDVPVAYRSGMVRIQLPYVPVDAIATGDFTIWIYDVTNGALIQPTPYQVEGRTAGTPGAVVAEFQAPYNMAQGRLLWHVATTSASQLRVDVDEIQVGPGSRVFGSAMQDSDMHPVWIPTGTWTSNVTYVGKWNRVGDMLEARVEVQLTGAPTSAILRVNLPPGLRIDTTKLPSADTAGLVGYCSLLDSGAKNYTIGNVGFNSTTSVEPLYDDGSSGAQNITQAAPFTFANGDKVFLFFRVPILGWGSNCQMSSDAETRVVAAHCYIDGANVLAPNASAVKILLSNASEDTHNGFVAANNRYVIQVPGRYNVSARTNIYGANVLNSIYFLTLYKNGSEIRRGHEAIPVATNNVGYTALGMDIDCKAGDYLELYLYGAGNNSINTISNGYGTAACFMDISRISGPSQIAASEKVMVTAISSASTSIAGSGAFTLAPFATVVKDSHGAWNGSRFTAPKADRYTLKCKTTFAAYSGALNYINLCIYKNGSLYRYIATISEFSGVTAYWSINGEGDFDLNTGDYLEVYLEKASSGAQTLLGQAVHNWINIKSS